MYEIGKTQHSLKGSWPSLFLNKHPINKINKCINKIQKQYPSSTMSQPGIYTNNQALPQQNLPVLNGSPPVTVINGPGYPYGSIPNTNHNNFGSRVIGGSRINGNVITNSYGPPGVRVVNGGSIGSNIYPHGQSIISHQSSIRK